MIKIVWKCINIIAISPKRGMEQAEIIDTFWTYHLPGRVVRRGELLLGCLGWPSRRAPLAGALVLWFGRPGKLLLPGSCLLGPASSSCRGLVFLAQVLGLRLAQKGPWRFLAFPWQALPQGATTARAQVRGTRVPLF